MKIATVKPDPSSVGFLVDCPAAKVHDLFPTQGTAIQAALGGLNGGSWDAVKIAPRTEGDMTTVHFKEEVFA